MKKQTLNIAIGMAVLLAMSASAHAGAQVTVPDSCTTSFLLAGAAGVLGFARRFVR
jgi:hypothetical protein